MSYQPTLKFRWLNFTLGEANHPNAIPLWPDSNVAMVLQQQWIEPFEPGEAHWPGVAQWRDIPIEWDVK